jgi:Flp pilus assembly protein TadG
MKLPRMAKRVKRAQRGQALVEFAFALPLFVLFVFSVIQLSLLFVAYYSETRMARETARWVAINNDSTDAQVAQHVSDTMLPGLNNGTPQLCLPTVCTFTTDTVYDVGRMRVQFAPCVPLGAICSSISRVAGQTLYVQLTYDVTNLLFLPSTFRMGYLTTKIPTQLPVYRVYTMVE